MSEQQANFVNEQQQPWLENLKKKVDQFENSTLQIYAGSAKVYEQVGKQVTLNKLEGDTNQKVQQALETPQSLKSSVRIMLDGEKVFHAKQGEVLENKLPLAVAAAQSATAKQVKEPELQAETKLENQPETVAVQPEILPTVGVETKKELLQPELVPQSWDDIRNLIAENEQKLDGLENSILNLLTHQVQQLNEMQQKLDDLQKRKPPLNAQVGQFFSSLKDTTANSLQELKQRAQQLPQDIKQFLGNKATEIQQKVVSHTNDMKQNVIGKIEDLKAAAVNKVNATKEMAVGKVVELKDSVDRSLADVSAKALDSANRWLVNKFGKDPEGTGTKVWKGNDYTFTASGQNTSILNKSGQEIAKDGKLTPAATQQDANRLIKLPQDVQQMAQKLQEQQKPVAGVGLKR